jgi:hypothetical protein
MNLLNNLFGKKDQPIRSYADFWAWFQVNQQAFYDVVKSGKNHEKDFFDKLSPKLNALKEGCFYLTGMCDAHTAELVLTPDGIIKNIAFVEELVASAPTIPNWKFTALKQALDIGNIRIDMGQYTFDRDSLSFYALEDSNLPDQVDIVVVHSGFKEADKSAIINGVYIFLDNFLGELNAITTIDNLTVISKSQAKKELIPIEKLKDYLIWREKEFVEKYDGFRYDTEQDKYASFQAELENGCPLIAIMNTTLLEWDSKMSHPWILRFIANYDGSASNGLPDKKTFEMLNQVEDELMDQLKDADGYLNIGRQTADNTREIYYACKEFRKPSKVLHELTKKYSEKLDVTFKLYKDKYWQSFQHFRAH